MGVKKFKPVTPGQRGMTGYSFEEITKSKPERALVIPRRKSGGRNIGRHIADGQDRAAAQINGARRDAWKPS